MASLKYRKDIDGLRAIAVLLVLFFHVGFNFFQGGYVGVDVFFVISGYLITRLIKEQVEDGSFDFGIFYERRARRLLPALIFTVIICFIPAIILFTPQHLTRFGGEVLHSLTFISNFYYWKTTGYFDVASDFKPLLHTWSLCVEEQFYFVWPVLLVFMLKRFGQKKALFVMLALSVISLMMNKAHIDAVATVFYLAPYRVFEFGIGASLVWLIKKQSSDFKFKDLSTAIGLLLIFYAATAFTKETTFPSFNALIPCIGSALVIMGGEGKLGQFFLGNSLAQWFGRISYSIYLIHWPLIVFYKYYTLEELSSLEMLSICFLTLGQAYLMYTYVEDPLRKSRRLSAPAFGLVCASIAVALIVPAANMWSQGGWAWRFDKNQNFERFFTKNEFDDYVWVNHNQYASDFRNEKGHKVFVVGDSQSGDFVNMLVESGLTSQMNLRTLKIFSKCLPLLPSEDDFYDKVAKGWKERCQKLHHKLSQHENLKKADVVVLVASWPLWSVPYLEKTVTDMKKLGVNKVVVVGAKSQIQGGVTLLKKLKLSENLSSYRLEKKLAVVKINESLQRASTSFTFINILDAICRDNLCPAFTELGNMIYYDGTHLTPHGAKYYGVELQRQGFLDVLLGK